MIVDFHTHCFPDAIANKAVKVLADRANVMPKLNGSINDLKKSMQRAKINISILLPIATKPSQTVAINNWAAKISKGNIISFGSIHPEYEMWKEELIRIKTLGLKGIKLHPDYQGFFVDDAKMYPIYEMISDLGLILVFHAGIDIGLPAPYHCTPKRLLNILNIFPKINIVAAHMGGFKYWDDVEKYLVGEKIYLDTSYSLGHISNKQFIRIIKNHDPAKILFGTDSPWTDQLEEIKKIQLFSDKIPLTNILGENVQGLLKKS